MCSFYHNRRVAASNRIGVVACNALLRSTSLYLECPSPEYLVVSSSCKSHTEALRYIEYNRLDYLDRHV